MAVLYYTVSVYSKCPCYFFCFRLTQWPTFQTTNFYVYIYTYTTVWQKPCVFLKKKNMNTLYFPRCISASFIFCYSDFHSKPRCPILPCFPAMCCNLARGTRRWEIRAIYVFFAFFFLCSAFVLHWRLCRGGGETVRCTVKLWRKGNEEMLSFTHLNTIQIGFAGIPVIDRPSHPHGIFALLYL